MHHSRRLSTYIFSCLLLYAVYLALSCHAFFGFHAYADISDDIKKLRGKGKDEDPSVAVAAADRLINQLGEWKEQETLSAKEKRDCKRVEKALLDEFTKRSDRVIQGVQEKVAERMADYLDQPKVLEAYVEVLQSGRHDMAARKAAARASQSSAFGEAAVEKASELRAALAEFCETPVPGKDYETLGLQQDLIDQLLGHLDEEKVRENLSQVLKNPESDSDLRQALLNEVLPYWQGLSGLNGREKLASQSFEAALIASINQDDLDYGQRTKVIDALATTQPSKAVRTALFEIVRDNDEEVYFRLLALRYAYLALRLDGGEDREAGRNFTTKLRQLWENPRNKNQTLLLEEVAYLVSRLAAHAQAEVAETFASSLQAEGFGRQEGGRLQAAAATALFELQPVDAAGAEATDWQEVADSMQFQARRLSDSNEVAKARAASFRLFAKLEGVEAQTLPVLAEHLFAKRPKIERGQAIHNLDFEPDPKARAAAAQALGSVDLSDVSEATRAEVESVFERYISVESVIEGVESTARALAGEQDGDADALFRVIHTRLMLAAMLCDVLRYDGDAEVQAAALETLLIWREEIPQSMHLSWYSTREGEFHTHHNDTEFVSGIYGLSLAWVALENFPEPFSRADFVEEIQGVLRDRDRFEKWTFMQAAAKALGIIARHTEEGQQQTELIERLVAVLREKRYRRRDRVMRVALGELAKLPLERLEPHLKDIGEAISQYAATRNARKVLAGVIVSLEPLVASALDEPRHVEDHSPRKSVLLAAFGEPLDQLVKSSHTIEVKIAAAEVLYRLRS